jgi:sigma-E factor negative regulatory protein RseB
VVHRAQHPQPASAESNTAALPRQEWGVHWLPRGFAATEARVAGEVRRTYTDGLAVFSIFLEELPTDIRPGEGVMRHGGTVSYTRGLQLADKPVLITVIGEVPVNTARMVADSVRWSR